MSVILKKFYYKMHIDKCLGQFFSFLSFAFGKSLSILNEKETVERIIKYNLSVSRFGDGELHIAQEGCAIGFQKSDEVLKNRLRGILKDYFDSSKICVCLPSCINDVSWMTDEAKNVWNNDLKYNRFYWKRLINKKNIYGDTQFTRPYIDYADKSNAIDRFNHIKEIWKNRDLLIVEGEKSKLGVGNNLFNEADSVKRILCPAENAFDKYDRILNTVTKYDKKYLILIALGPTATVLAFDLCKLGYQSVDIGHIDIEYEWCKSGVKEKKAIKGKYTNESKDNGNTEYLSCDTEYKKQIAERVL